MQITLLCIGKTNLLGVGDLIGEYEKRLTRFCSFSLLVLPDIKNPSALTKEQLMKKEGDLFLDKIKAHDILILLDENGSEYSSSQFANKLNDWFQLGSGKCVFVIGGAYGFDLELKKRANFTLSLSKMTFNHQMVRAIFIEQLYRGFAILKGLPYHHA